MTETVQFCHEVIFRCISRIFLYDSIQFGIVRISKKYRFDIGIVHTNMLHTILFLITACQLVLLDVAFQIIIHISAYDQAVLCMSIHSLCIHIILFFLILNQPTFILEHLKVLGSLFVNGRIMFVCSHREIYFRLDDMV